MCVKSSENESLVKVEVYLVDVTPEMAHNLLLDNDYEYQRKLRDRYVTYYAKEIEEGRFKKYTTIELAFLDGKGFIEDGQHRLAAIKRSGISVPMCIQKRYYKHISDIAADYARTDYGKKRSWADVINALHEAMGKKERLILTNTDFNAMKSAFGAIYRGFMTDGQPVDRVMLYDKTLEWQPYAKSYFDAIGHNSRDEVNKALRRKHIVAMGMVTMRFSDYYLPENKSTFDFWRQVSFDDGIKMHDPRKKLREILFKSQVQSTPSQSRNFRARDLLMYTQRAWLAYCNDEELHRLIMPKDQFVNIHYTPFDSSMTIQEYRDAFEKSDWGKKWVST